MSVTVEIVQEGWVLHWLNILCCLGISGFLLLLAFSSYQEKEFRAVKISLGMLAGNLIFWHLVDHALPWGLNALILLFVAAFTGISLARFFPKSQPPRDMSRAEIFDERDQMFSRNNLPSHPQDMEEFYGRHPEFESIDRQIHNKPDFGSPEQTFHDDYAVPLYEAAFEYLHQTIPASDGELSPRKENINIEKITQTLKAMVRYYGGCDMGIVKLEPYHFYSHKGRHAQDWGKETDPTYKTAVVIVTAMDPAMLKKAPTGSIIQESARHYVEAAKISNILAGYLRKFGYRARAHNDANYETLCVPLAVESGMGELGRMGIFMHPVHGPCVRLAVVTTDMELPSTVSSQENHMAEFCRICKKCADNCPSKSICRGGEPSSRNFRHWSIDQEKCFSYWKTIGSDCGMCIAVCPYTKPDTPIHRLVRFYISRNPVNQRIALWMDDLFYGRIHRISGKNPERIF